jgi:hypothetical protein
MSCFDQCPPCTGCAAKDAEIARLTDARDRLASRLYREIARERARAEAVEAKRDALAEALEKIAKLAADREAFMFLGPRAFAQAERIALDALATDTAKETA